MALRRDSESRRTESKFGRGDSSLGPRSHYRNRKLRGKLKLEPQRVAREAYTEHMMTIAPPAPIYCPLDLNLLSLPKRSRKKRVLSTVLYIADAKQATGQLRITEIQIGPRMLGIIESNARYTKAMEAAARQRQQTYDDG